MSKFIRVFAAGVLLAGLPMAALGQVSVNVQVQINQACSVSAPVDASFGAQTPLASTPLTTTGAVTLTCNHGAAPQVMVGNGANHDGTTRRMRRPATTDYIAYSIMKSTFVGPGFTSCPLHGAGTAWGDAGAARLAAGAAFASSGGPRTVNLCFQTTVDETMPVATYSDIVLVSVGF